MRVSTLTTSAICGSPVWRSTSSPTRSRSSTTSSGGPTMRAFSPSPSTQAISWRALAYGVTNSRSPPSAVRRRRRAHLPVAAEVALDLPGDPLADPDLGGPDRLAELPVDPVGVRARVEVRRALEVVLGLGRVADLAADPRQPEHADRAALVRAPDDVELSALVQQLVGVDAARADLVALHRVVVEHDRLAAEDRGLDLRQPLRDVVAAGGAGDPERDRVLLRGASGLGRPQEICCSASRSGSA